MGRRIYHRRWDVQDGKWQVMRWEGKTNLPHDIGHRTSKMVKFPKPGENLVKFPKPGENLVKLIEEAFYTLKFHQKTRFFIFLGEIYPFWRWN